MKTQEQSDAASVARSWETYWNGTAQAGAYGVGGVSHPAIHEFWDKFFATLKHRKDPLSLLDIASGNGAVIECALAVTSDKPMAISCVDISPASISNIRDRFPDVRGVVCDARQIPMESGSFDVITSQFGVEYAGLEAISEAARLLTEGGEMALLLHHRYGVIHLECAASLDATSRVRESGFIPLAIEMFKSGFAAVRGADRAPYDSAASQLAPAVKTLEDILAEHGEHVAGDTVARLYRDVVGIHAKMQRFDPDEVLEWLGRMNDELEAYVARMSSMMESSIDDTGLKKICADLETSKCNLRQAGPLMAPGIALPLAWIIVAARPAITEI